MQVKQLIENRVFSLIKATKTIFFFYSFVWVTKYEKLLLLNVHHKNVIIFNFKLCARFFLCNQNETYFQQKKIKQLFNWKVKQKLTT